MKYSHKLILRFALLVGLLKICYVPLHSQSWELEMRAFQQSYEAEADSNFSEAIEHLVKIYQDQSYELNLRLGWLYYLNGDYPRSLNYYHRAMDLLPYAVEAKLGYVLPQSAMGNWDEVINIYQEILKADPHNTLVNYRMGAIYYQRQDYQLAFQFLEKVVNFYPFDFDSVILLAWTNYRLGKYREAKVLFEKALMIVPENPSAIEGLGLIE